MSSIDQAKQINLNGVYTIGRVENVTSNDDCLENWISLKAEFESEKLEQHGNESTAKKPAKRVKEIKRFKYEELNELKSMIMLVAKRSLIDTQEDENAILEYFIEVFDNVVRLTETYRKLVNKGARTYFHAKYLAILNK
jgi:hypothetical protein